MITDSDIRKELKKIYKSTPKKKTILPKVRMIDELAIPKYTCLADVVAIPILENVSDGFHGFEIKSEVDSLTRLQSQVLYYSKVFKKCTIVLAEKHEEKAMDIIPDWWGVTVAVRTKFDKYSEWKDEFILLETRQALVNPEPLTAYSLVQLLWRNELLSIIKEQKVEVKKSGAKRLLREAIAKQVPIDELEPMVVSYLCNRTDWKIPGQPYKGTKRTSSKTKKRTRIRVSKKTRIPKNQLNKR